MENIFLNIFLWLSWCLVGLLINIFVVIIFIVMLVVIIGSIIMFGGYDMVVLKVDFFWLRSLLILSYKNWFKF